MIFTKELIPWEAILDQPFERFWLPSQSIQDYVTGAPSLQEFYETQPTEEGIINAIGSKNMESVNRELLVEVLQEQYAKLDTDTTHIDRLASTNTYTVCTGHQLCLFGGPLFFIYKIISAIRLAEELSQKHPSCHFVPVFWMASEDHDFDEINHIYIFNNKLTWNSDQGGMVGDYETESMQGAMDQLSQLLDKEPHGPYVLELFQKAYLNHASLADATRCWVHELFGKYGLVIIDGNDPRLKNQFLAVFKDDLTRDIPGQHLKSGSDAFSQSYQLQAQVRDINTFYLLPNDRKRIEKEEDGYRLGNNGEQIGEADLLARLNTHPERFSPNVLLRPLYQEMILPNLAYVGGPAELGYWFQLRSLFSHYNISFPALVLRNSAVLLQKGMAQNLYELGFRSKDLLRSPDQLARSFLSDKMDNNIPLSREVEELGALVAKLKQEKGGSTPLGKGELARSLKALKGLEKKLTRQGKEQQAEGIGQIKKLYNFIYPYGKPQERVASTTQYLAAYGPGFMDALKNQMDPLSKGLMVFRESDG